MTSGNLGTISLEINTNLLQPILIANVLRKSVRENVFFFSTKKIVEKEKSMIQKVSTRSIFRKPETDDPEDDANRFSGKKCFRKRVL